MGLLPVQGTDTTAADRVGFDTQRRPKLLGLKPVQNLIKRMRLQTADRFMKETGAHQPVGFNYGRSPRCVAAGRFWCCQPKLHSEVPDNSLEFVRILENEAGS